MHSFLKFILEMKHVEFHSKNKFEKSVHLVGFVIRNLSRRTVTWTSKSERIFEASFLVRLMALELGSQICRQPNTKTIYRFKILSYRLLFSTIVLQGQEDTDYMG
jgi:hypothetical protein